MYYVGLDIHQRSTSVEILDCNGKLVKRAEWKLPWPQLADQLKKDTPAPFAAYRRAARDRRLRRDIRANAFAAMAPMEPQCPAFARSGSRPASFFSFM